MKYYIKSVFDTYFSNKLIFNTAFEDIMIFDSEEDAKQTIDMYGLDNCTVKSK